MEFEGIEAVCDPGWAGHTVLDMKQIAQNVADGMYQCWEQASNFTTKPPLSLPFLVSALPTVAKARSRAGALADSPGASAARCSSGTICCWRCAPTPPRPPPESGGPAPVLRAANNPRCRPRCATC
jgi:hypothetical protein